MAKSKRPRTASTTGYGILNPYGDMWSPEVFSTIGQAKGHLERFWRREDWGKDQDLTKFKIVRARQVAHFVGEVGPEHSNGVGTSK